jgi:hypothetical protein
MPYRIRNPPYPSPGRVPWNNVSSSKEAFRLDNRWLRNIDNAIAPVVVGLSQIRETPYDG